MITREGGEFNCLQGMKALICPIVKQIWLPIALHALTGSIVLSINKQTAAYHLVSYKPSIPSTAELHGLGEEEASVFPQCIQDESNLNWDQCDQKKTPNFYKSCLKLFH